jgi:CHAT domain-containing protein/Tfp pilus assembly protein PilF
MFKRLSTVVFFITVTGVTHGYGMSDGDRDRYLAWVELLETGEAALAIADDFIWAAGWGEQEQEAKYDAMTKCRGYSKKPGTCRIVDVGGVSNFIKRKNPSFTQVISSEISPEIKEKLNSYTTRLSELYRTGRYEEAIPIANQLLEFGRGLNGLEGESIGLAWLGALYVGLVRYEDAVRTYRKQLQNEKKTFHPEHIRVAATLVNLASVYSDTGKYNEAEPLLHQALLIQEKSHGKAHEDVASTLQNLAHLYVQQARYTEAEPLFRRSLDIREKVLGPEHPGVALTLGGLGTLYAYLGRYEEALSLFDRSLKINEKSLGSTHLQVATAASNLAGIYADLGRYSESQKQYERALFIVEQAAGTDNPGFATTLRNLAHLYALQYRYDEALLIYKRSLEIRDKVLGPDHPDVAIVLNDLGNIKRSLGLYGEAETHYQLSLAIYEKSLNPKHPRVAHVINNLGNLYATQGHYQKAIAYFDQALDILEATLGRKDVTYSNVLHNKAGLHFAKNEFVEASRLYELALDIDKKALGVDHPTVAQGQITLGAIYTHQGRLRDAIGLVRDANAALRRRFTAQNVAETKGILSEQQSARSGFTLHVDLALHPSQDGNREELEAEAFEVMQLGRTSRTAGALARMAARFASDSDGLALIIRQQQDSLVYYEKLGSNLIQTLGEQGKSQDSSAVGQIRAALKAQEAKLEGLGQTIQELFPEYAELTSREPISLKAIQKLLDRDELLLTMEQGYADRLTHVFVVRSDKSTTYTVDLGIEELETMVSKLRAGLDPATGHSQAFDVGLAYELYRRLLSPAEPMLSGVRHLFVVPDGPLESLPFHLLVTEDPAGISLPGLKSTGQRGFSIESDLDQGSSETTLDTPDIAWLAKKYAITTLPSIASLRALRVFAKKAQATESFIGFGDPVLRGESDSGEGLQVASFFRGAVADVEEVRQLPSLPETEAELKAMADYLGADEMSIYLRDRATETRVKSLNLKDYQVVAFSTHGLVSGELKGLAEPALVLTPPDKGTKHDDGLLTASEVAQLKLDADWVILSACNTAAGDKPGAAGLSGLAKAFFYAGARTLLVSHWPVQSDAATALTTNMFQKLKQNPVIGRAEALRQSMMSMAANLETAHPFFWAPFVVVGEGG